MSDYLGNLVARSLDPAPALRPRLASRFEPLAAAAPPLWASPAAEEPALIEEAVEVRAEPPRPRRSRRRVAVEEMEEGREAEAAEGVVPQRRGGRRRGVPFEASPPGPLSSGAGEGERRRSTSPRGAVGSARPVVERSPSPAELERGPGGEASRVDRSGHEGEARPVQPKSADSGQSPRRTVRPTLQPPDGFETSPLPSRKRTPKDEAAPADRPHVKAKPDTPARLQPRVTLLERPPAPVQTAAPAAEPVIQVTIGRIEVRATQPAQPPSRPRPSAPSAMSLEEYLRRRSRRGD